MKKGLIPKEKLEIVEALLKKGVPQRRIERVAGISLGTIRKVLKNIPHEEIAQFSFSGFLQNCLARSIIEDPIGKAMEKIVGLDEARTMANETVKTMNILTAPQIEPEMKCYFRLAEALIRGFEFHFGPLERMSKVLFQKHCEELLQKSAEQLPQNKAELLESFREAIVKYFRPYIKPVWSKSTIEIFESTLYTLPPEEQIVIRMFFGIGEFAPGSDFEEVGKALKVTPERARQMLAKALLRIKRGKFILLSPLVSALPCVTGMGCEIGVPKLERKQR